VHLLVKKKFWRYQNALYNNKKTGRNPQYRLTLNIRNVFLQLQCVRNCGWTICIQIQNKHRKIFCNFHKWQIRGSNHQIFFLFLVYFVIVSCVNNARQVKDEYKTTFFSSFSRLYISYCYYLLRLTHCLSSSLILANVFCSSFSMIRIFYLQDDKNFLSHMNSFHLIANERDFCNYCISSLEWEILNYGCFELFC
jgi:hypothetical protein